MAMASTVAHDSHHMIVVGTDRDDDGAAANRLGEVGGGITVWKDGAELALVELPIAGLMSDSPRRSGRQGRPDGRGDGRLRLHAEQRLYAAFAAGAGGHPLVTDLRSGAGRCRPSLKLPICSRKTHERCTRGVQSGRLTVPAPEAFTDAKRGGGPGLQELYDTAVKFLPRIFRQLC